MNNGVLGLISVIMPAYNAEATIAQAIASVCKQTYADLELIVVNDGSKDQTGVLVEKMMASDARIHFIDRKSNQGVSATRQEGVQAASGDWIAFLDSDDVWMPEKLEKQVMLQQKTDAEFLFTASAFMSSDGKRMDWVLHVPNKVAYKDLLKQNVLSNSSVLVKKELFLKHSVVDDTMHEDYACWLNVLRSGRIAYGVDEPLIVYRVSANSKSGNKLKAAKMNWNTYRAVGLDVIQSGYYMAWYTGRGILKYRHLHP